MHFTHLHRVRVWRIGSRSPNVFGGVIVVAFRPMGAWKDYMVILLDITRYVPVFDKHFSACYHFGAPLEGLCRVPVFRGFLPLQAQEEGE